MTGKLRVSLRILSRFLILLLTIGLIGRGFLEAGNNQRGPSIYISVDMECIGTIVSSAQTSSSQWEYSRGRKLMTAEVNAVIQGCLEAGAGKIVVADSHGNAQNIIPEELNEAALLIRSFPRPLLQIEGIDETFDGVIFIGYHPKEGTLQANLSHTLWGSKIFELKINGLALSEAMFNAAVAGHFGVPVIMVAGDQNVVAEAKAVFGPVETVQIKTSLGWLSAMARHPKLIRQKLKAAVKRAVERIKEIKPYRLEPPLRMELTFKHIYDAEAFAYLPWVERVGGKTIAFETDNILDINHFLTALFSINKR